MQYLSRENSVDELGRGKELTEPFTCFFVSNASNLHCEVDM